MAERAGLFEEDFDVSAFTPKKPVKAAPKAEAVRAVSEAADFTSREPVQKPQKAAVKKRDRRHRTGRNTQLAVKVTGETLETFYKIVDSTRWVQGYVIERALEALQRELGAPGQGIDKPGGEE